MTSQETRSIVSIFFYDIQEYISKMSDDPSKSQCIVYIYNIISRIAEPYKESDHEVILI